MDDAGRLVVAQVTVRVTAIASPPRRVAPVSASDLGKAGYLAAMSACNAVETRSVTSSQ